MANATAGCAWLTGAMNAVAALTDAIAAGAVWTA